MRLNKKVLCIIFRRVNNNFMFLLLRRIPIKGGFWQPISGGMESFDDLLLTTVYREVLEETGITKKGILIVTPKVHSFIMDCSHISGEPFNSITEYVFGVEVKNDVVVSLDVNVYPEHDKYRWVSFNEALSLLKWDNNKVGFQKLKEFLEK